MMEARQTPIFPCIWQAILIAVGFVVLQLIIGIIVAIPAFIVGNMISEKDVVQIAVQAGTSFGMILCTFVLLGILCRFSVEKMLSFFKMPKRMTWGLSIGLILFILGMTVISSEINNLTQKVLPVPEFFHQVMVNLFKEPISAFFVVCIGAPLMEEVLFRGIIVRGFSSRYSTAKTMIVSGILFALVHLNPLQFFTAFVIGAALAYLYIRTESLWLPIACHFLNNFLAWLFVYDFRPFDMPGYTGISSEGLQPFWFDCLGIFLFGLGTVLAFRALRSEPGDTDSAPSPQPPPLPQPEEIFAGPSALEDGYA